MRRIKTISGISAAFGMLLLILDSKTALTGATEGMELCLKTVIPSLFPFFVLSAVLTSSLMGTNTWLLAPIGKLCGIPPGAESILITGLIGGYPLGAKGIAQAFCAGQLSKEDARRMMAFCSNAGPAFLFGMAGAMFHSRMIPWLLWMIHILSAIITGMILPKTSSSRSAVSSGPPVMLPHALRNAISAMANICGWVILFRILIAFLDRWILWTVPDLLGVIVSGFLELSNGCCLLGKISNTGLRFIVCSVILAFGGLCVTMQTVSATPGVDRSLYIPGKLLQISVSIFLACIVQWVIPEIEQAAYSLDILIVSAFTTLILIGILRKMQKSSSIPSPVGV